MVNIPCIYIDQCTSDAFNSNGTILMTKCHFTIFIYGVIVW